MNEIVFSLPPDKEQTWNSQTLIFDTRKTRSWKALSVAIKFQYLCRELILKARLVRQIQTFKALLSSVRQL